MGVTSLDFHHRSRHIRIFTTLLLSIFLRVFLLLFVLLTPFLPLHGVGLQVQFLRELEPRVDLNLLKGLHAESEALQMEHQHVWEGFQ